MAIVRAFNAVRPVSEHAAQVAAVPYDVVNTTEARGLAEGNPLSFLHVSRPEIDLPEGTDLYSDAVYEKAAANFKKLTSECPLIHEDTASLYVYRLVMDGHEQIGIAACCAVDEYDGDVIRKHERTRPDKEDDRTRHMLALGAQTGPVFLTYRATAEIDALVSEVMTGTTPLYDFTAADDISHTVWRIQNSESLTSAFAGVPYLYIADGHHRAASASRARAAMKQQTPKGTPEEEFNFFLCVIFPDRQLQILPYNRLVKDLNGLSETGFFDQIKERFVVSADAPPTPAARGNWSMYLNGRWYGLSRLSESPAADGVVANLDASILQDELLAPILGIKDVRTDKRIDFVGGIRGTNALAAAVSNGQAQVAFSLYPTTVEDLILVSDAGEIMPPKSTWFEPKLRDGLLIHSF